VKDGESETNGTSYGEHWGWWGTLYSLAKTDILKITGDRKLTDLNFITTLNYLEIDKDYNKEMEKMQKEAIRKAKYQ